MKYLSLPHLFNEETAYMKVKKKPEYTIRDKWTTVLQKSNMLFNGGYTFLFKTYEHYEEYKKPIYCVTHFYTPTDETIKKFKNFTLNSNLFNSSQKNKRYSEDVMELYRTMVDESYEGAAEYIDSLTVVWFTVFNNIANLNEQNSLVYSYDEIDYIQDIWNWTKNGSEIYRENDKLTVKNKNGKTFVDLLEDELSLFEPRNAFINLFIPNRNK